MRRRPRSPDSSFNKILLMYCGFVSWMPRPGGGKGAIAPLHLPFSRQARPSLRGEQHRGDKSQAASGSVARCDTTGKRARSLEFAPPGLNPVASCDRPGMVTGNTHAELQSETFSQWAEPLESNFAGIGRE